MPMKRFALPNARDKSEPAIIEALKKAGFQVWTKLPCDLLTWRPDKGFQLLENKTPTKTGKRRKRTDQEAQDAFIRLTGTPVVLTPEDALKALGAM
jgi:hypothetical protein